MQRWMQQMSIENQNQAPKAESPPINQSFQVTRMGLPLDRVDNIKCALVLLLTASLQIRLQHTILAEGWIIFFGLTGYLVMRYWLLRHRYPVVGAIELKADSIIFPDCIDQGKNTIFELKDEISFIFYFWKGKSGPVLSSVEIIQNKERIKVNWLGLDLAEFERAIIARKLPNRREEWNANRPIIIFLVIATTIILSWLFIVESLK